LATCSGADWRRCEILNDSTASRKHDESLDKKKRNRLFHSKLVDAKSSP
jgi:hypothetical protein